MPLHADDHAAAREAIEFLEARLSPDDFAQFKVLYRKAGLAFDVEMFD